MWINLIDRIFFKHWYSLLIVLFVFAIVISVIVTRPDMHQDTATPLTGKTQDMIKEQTQAKVLPPSSINKLQTDLSDQLQQSRAPTTPDAEAPIDTLVPENESALLDEEVLEEYSRLLQTTDGDLDLDILEEEIELLELNPDL